MVKINKSIIVSNILDPYTKNIRDLKTVYQKLFDENRYNSIETRLIDDDELIAYFNAVRLKNVKTTYYLTGVLSRMNLSLCSEDSNNRLKAIEVVKEALLVSSKTNLDYLGLASGKIENNALLNLDLFVDSLDRIFRFIKERNLNIKIAIEPLDQYAHKKNVIGSLDMTLRLIKKLESLAYDQNDWMIVYDTAHFALNEDDLIDSIQKLSKYIYRIHFANAILDKTDELYGDRHMPFKGGFLTKTLAIKIIDSALIYLDHDFELAVEIREKDKSHAWDLERESYEYLDDVINSSTYLQH